MMNPAFRPAAVSQCRGRALVLHGCSRLLPPPSLRSPNTRADPAGVDAGGDGGSPCPPVSPRRRAPSRALGVAPAPSWTVISLVPGVSCGPSLRGANLASAPPRCSRRPVYLFPSLPGFDFSFACFCGPAGVASGGQSSGPATRGKTNRPAGFLAARMRQSGRASTLSVPLRGA